MCLILLAYRQHPKYELIIAANRDEFYERAALPACFWEDCPQLLAGRDLVKGGTWMGVSRTGEIAAVTNYRDPLTNNPQAKSRGALVTDYLCSQTGPLDYLTDIHQHSDIYNGFNLLVGDVKSLLFYSNRQRQIIRVTDGIHGLSNHLLDTPWPKVELGKAGVAEILKVPEQEWEAAFWRLLTNRSYPPEAQLPSTGVPPEWERALSPVFITTPGYGTRTNTLILITYTGNIRFLERTYQPFEESWERREFEFDIF